MRNFNNISSVTNVQYSFACHESEIILEFLWACWIPNLFQHWPTSDVLCLFTKMRSYRNFSHHDEFHEYFIIDLHPMLFFSSSKWDHFRISLRMMNFNNISSVSNIQYSFSFREHTIVLQFLWRWWISAIFHHWRASDVLFLFIKIRSFQNFAQDDEFLEYFISEPREILFFFSWKWDHFRISLSMLSSKCISALTNDRCYFSLQQNEIIFEFLSSWGISTMLRHWPTCDVVFLLIKIRSF